MLSLENLKCDMSIILNNGKKVSVFYDNVKEKSYIVKSDVIITIHDIKNMTCDIIRNLCNMVYDIKCIDYINKDMFESYYNQLNENIESDFYMEDSIILKELFDDYISNNNL